MSSQIPQSISAHPKALITGGSGFVGSHLAEKLSSLGFDIYLLLRSTSKLDNLAALNYRTITGDLRNSGELAEILPEIEYVFHSAGLVKASSLEHFMSVNRDGTAKLIELAVTHAPNLKRFVYLSSQSAAGPCRDQKPKCEQETPAPVSDYGMSKLAGEVAVLAASQQIPVTIIRPSAVFGPRDTEVLNFFRSVKLGLMLKFGRKENFVSIVYIDDLVEAIIRAALNDKAIGETFFVNTQDEISQWEAQRLIADAIKVDIRPLVAPLALLKLAGSVLGSIDRGMGRVPFFSRDKAQELSCRYWLSSSAKAREMLGFSPQTTLPEAFAATYRWYIDRGWL